MNDPQKLQHENARLKKRLNELTSSLNFFQGIMKSGNLCWWEFNLKTGVSKFSPKLAEMLGMDSANFMQESIKNIISSEDLEIIQEKIGLLLSGQTDIYEAEFKAKDKNGRLHWFSNRGNITEYDDTGTPIIMSGITFDITEHKKFELALESAGEKYRQLLNDKNNAVMLCAMTENKPTKFIEVNNAACKLFNMTRQEFFSSSCHNLLALTTDESVLEKYYKKLVRQGSVSFNTDRIDKNGDKNPIELSASLFELDQEPMVLITARQITERVSAQLALAELEEKYHTLTNTIPVIVFRYRLTPKPELEYINHAVEKITGYTVDEFRANNATAKKLISLQALKHLKEPQSVSAELKLHNKNKQEIVLEAIEMPIFDNAGELIAVEGIATDVTDHVRMLKEAEKNLKIEKLLSNITSSFLTQTNLDSALELALEDMGKFSNAARVYIFLINDDKKTVSNTVEWSAPGVSSEKDNMQNIPMSDYPWWFEQLKNNKNIILEDVKAIPPEALNEKAIVEAQSITAVLVLPLYLHGRFAGFIGFDEVKGCRKWEECDVKILSVASQIIASVIERQQKDEAVRTSEEKYRQLFSKMKNAFALYQAVYSPQGKITDLKVISANSAFEELFQQPLAALTGKNISELLPDSLRYLLTHFNHLAKQKQASGFEMLLSELNKYVSLDAYSPQPGKFATIITDLTQHRQTAHSLKQSEERYRKVLHGLPDMIFRMNKKGEFIDAHIHNYHELMIQPQDFIGKRIIDVLPQQMAKTTLKKIQKTLASKETSIYEYELPINDKTQFFEARIVYMSNNEVLCIVRNVSQRKHAEQEREEYKTYLEQVILYMPIAVFCKSGSDFKYTLANQKMENMLGVPSSEIINKTDYDLFAPELADKFRQEDIALLDSAGKIDNEVIFPDKHGNIKIVRCVKILIELQHKKHIFGLVQDITQQKIFEDELKTSEAKYRNLIESADDRIALLDLDGNIILANSTFYSAIGYTPEEYDIHQHFKSLFPEHESFLNHIIKNLEKQNSFSLEYKTFHKNGNELYMQAKAIFIRNKDGSPKGIFVNIRDISELKKIQQNLIAAKNHAEESDRLKSAFLANMSHEIRTPLNAVTGFANLLSDPTISENERQEYITAINKNSTQLLNLISDIIDISKIESGMIEIKRSNININNLIDSIYHNFLSHFVDPRVRLISSKVLDDEIAVIATDRTRLMQILNNLINNAIKFTDSGFIEFGYMPPENDKITFYVKDSGIGIPQEKHKIIFDRFRQVDESSTRKFGGTGLGLSICKKLVSILGGEMWVNSQEGKGATFLFTLPFKQNVDEYITVENIAKHKTQDDEFHWENKKILIVDDALISRKFLKALLKKTGITCITASSGAEAVSKCSSDRNIDVVLMDIQMPEMDGLEATWRIKAIRSDLPVIAQTAHALTGDRERILAAGCDEYVAKPINKNDLLQKINYFIQHGVS